MGLTLFANETNDTEKLKIENILKKKPLVFEPKDIRYIFIDDENERKKIIDMIKTIKSKKYSFEEIEILCSKIISYTQFLKDI